MIGAIIQARMTSTRLPGKVLLPVCGRPILDYLFRQLEQVEKIDTIVLATTTNKEDDPLADYAEANGYNCFRGSEPDVLERYYYAAKQYSIEHVIRITADCPFQDPEICHKLIALYQKDNVDFVHTGPTFAEGLDCEIFSFNALKEAYQKATLKSEREHLTLYMHAHADHFNKTILQNSTDDSKYRFTLDEEVDYQVIKAIIEGLSLAESEIYTADKVKSFLDSHPEIFALNANIIRNEGLQISLAADSVVN